MIKSNKMKPSCFTAQHYALAKEHGIQADRILFFEDLKELKKLALFHGVDQSTVDEYTVCTLGLCVRGDTSKGEEDETHIFIHRKLSDEAFEETYHRLKDQNLNPCYDLMVTSEHGLLYAFILLHELGHFRFKHECSTDVTELAADQWACAELWKFKDRFLNRGVPNRISSQKAREPNHSLSLNLSHEFPLGA